MVAISAAALAIICLVAAAFLLRRVGVGYRIARLLGAAPRVTLAEAVEAAGDERPRYLRVGGRITSDEEFPDEHARPLVFRRRRLQRADGRGGWSTIGEDRQAVPFGIEDRAAFVAIDADALSDGLVVVPRESQGVAGDLPPGLADRMGVTLDPQSSVRLRVDQVSAVEHATVAGVVTVGPRGVTLTAGEGRPLIVSTLDPDEAMRLLAGDRRGTVLAVAVAIVVGLGALATALVAVLAGW